MKQNKLEERNIRKEDRRIRKQKRKLKRKQLTKRVFKLAVLVIFFLTQST
jgi:hypothetical protein